MSRRSTRHRTVGALVITFAVSVLVGCALVGSGGSIWTGSPTNKAWKVVGQLIVSAGAVGEIAISSDLISTVSMVYQDWNVSGATARQLAANRWYDMGAQGFSGGVISTPSLAYSGGPTVAFVSSAGSVQVWQYGAGVWAQIGGVVSAGTAYNPSLVIDAGTPYVAYTDFVAPQSDAATVMRYNGLAWVPVGSQGFTGAGGAFSPSLGTTGSGLLYLAYVDGGLGNNVSVQLYNGSLWSIIGSGLGGTGTSGVSLAIDPFSLFPWVAFDDSPNGGRATVLRYDGSSWLVAGNRGFSTGAVSGVDLKFDSSGTPYILFSENGSPAVYRFDGSAWSRIGPQGFSPSGVSYARLAIDLDGAPLVAFKNDAAHGNAATVMKFY